MAAEADAADQQESEQFLDDVANDRIRLFRTPAGVDPVALKKRMTQLLVDRGAAVPAEHNYGRIYPAPEQLVAHYRELDPLNMFNAGVGETAAKKRWG